jgi:hypothetical protein
MQPVWVLSVDLQTKTATFQSGLSDAAKSARGAFAGIKSDAGEMGRSTSGSMMEARHGVMLLGEEFGVHLPRSLTTFIASIGPIGAAMEAAFPFLAIAVGATLLIEHLAALQAAGEKLTEDQVKFGTAVNNAFGQLDTKIIEAEIRSDELRNDHLGALALKLQLIDRQSMAELVHSFEEVEKAADVVMKGLEGHWYSFGRGSDGAKHALEQFQTQYDNLLAQGKSEQASGLLHGTATQAQKVLQALRDTEAYQGGGEMDDTKFQKGIAAAKVLQSIHVETGVTLTKQIEAQQALVDALNAQEGIESRIAQLKHIEGDNTKRAAGNAEAGVRAAAQREAAESQLRMGEMAISSDRATAKAQLDIHRASIEERLKSDIDFEGREQALHMAANQEEIAALDKSGKDYQNQLKALKDKALEINAQYEAKVSELTAKAASECAARDLRNLEQAEREKIEAANTGSATRLAAIEAAIKEEESKGLQDTAYYRQLQIQQVEAVRQANEEKARLNDEAIKQGIAAKAKAAEEETRHSSAMSKIEKPKGVNDFGAKKAELDKEYNANREELLKELADTEKMGKDKVAEARKVNDEIAALDRKHSNQEQELFKAQAQAGKVAAAETANAFGQSMLQVAEGHESMAKMARGAFEKMVSGALEAAIMQIAGEKSVQLAHAESAAAAAYSAMSGIPVVGPALGAVAAGTVFAAALAFENGGIVPGTGTGDTVPAMLTPGEGVVPKGVMEGLSNLAKSGGLSGGPAHVTHIHRVHFAPTIHALDSDGVDTVLEKHQATFQKHFENVLRKQNR